MWNRQVLVLMDGYDLSGYLDGTVTAPSPTITTNGDTNANPAYTVWKRQDQLIYSALLGAMYIAVQPMLSTTNTSAQIWSTLASTYAKPSRAHVKQLKQQLEQWKKGAKTVDEYVQGCTTRFDRIALLGKPIEHEDQIDYIISGLPEEYKHLADQIEARDTPPSITEIHEKLINYELKLQAQAPATVVPMTANAAYTHNTGNRGSNNRNHNRFLPKNNQTWQQQQTHQPRNNQNQGAGRGYQGKCQFCGVYGHSARRCPQAPSSGSATPWQPQANIAQVPHYNAANWILDSGTTHHLTTDLANLSMHQQYSGGEEVQVADGTGLQITHTGSGLLPTPSRPLQLKEVLYVPDVKKNLISVYRLCNTNCVSVEFFPAHFQVKDLSTGAKLPQGRTKNELYEWPVNKSNITVLAASPSPKTDLYSWHARLGHPSLSVLHNVVSQFSLPVSHSLQK